MNHVHHRFAAFVLTVLVCAPSLLAEQTDVAPVKEAQLGSTRNVHSCGTLLLAGQPAEADIAVIKEKGIKRIITLRQDDEVDWEAAKVKDAGLEFVAIPFQKPESLTGSVFERVRKLMREAEKTPTLLHCGSANRVGAVWLAYRVLDQGVPLETAVKEARGIGLRTPAYEERARRYIQEQSAEKSVRPGINKSFLDANLDVNEWIGRFEIESREVFAARNEVVKAIGVRPGDRVADIGAGTGFFTRLFSETVGTDGWVFAVDIAPQFVAHINQQAERDGLTNVTTVLCPGNSVSLPPQSVDIAFICDTYHHFEFPESTLASLHRALRPGGTLILIDFDVIPGKSREFILNHVRAPREVFRGEIESAGFAFVEHVKIDALEENYLLRFKKK